MEGAGKRNARLTCHAFADACFVQRFRVLAALKGHDNWVQCLVCIPQRGEVWSGSADRTIICWEWSTCAQVGRLHGHNDHVNSLARVGNRVYSGSQDGVIRVWDAKSRECVQEVSSGMRNIARLCGLSTEVWVCGVGDVVQIRDAGNISVLKGSVEGCSGYTSAVAQVGHMIWGGGPRVRLLCADGFGINTGIR